jgi:hypothetical protein
VRASLTVDGGFLRRRGYARVGARHWSHEGAIRYVGRDGDLKLRHSPAVRQVSSRAGANQTTRCSRHQLTAHTTAAPEPVSFSKWNSKKHETSNVQAQVVKVSGARIVGKRLLLTGRSIRVTALLNWSVLSGKRAGSTARVSSSRSSSKVRRDAYTACGTPCEKVNGCNHVYVSETRWEATSIHCADLSYSNFAVHHSRVQYVSTYTTQLVAEAVLIQRMRRKAILLRLWRTAQQACCLCSFGKHCRRKRQTMPVSNMKLGSYKVDCVRTFFSLHFVP